ncbi:MAG: glycosyltransferase family 4 protein [Oscillospiraceae bacterium]|nr:glycosyltransferase family 4 protein [Oscillospiraceae bacterium]
MTTINMLSHADSVQGHGVLTAHDEQVELVRTELSDEFSVVENSWRSCDITHFHTINPDLLLRLPGARMKGKTVGYVHFLPETMDKSIRLPALARAVFYRYIIWFYKRMDYLVAVNPYFIERLAAYGVDPERVTYIPNFASEKEFFRLPDEKRRSLRQSYGLDPDRFTVVCAGQLQKRKGVFDFVSIAQRMPDVQFVWAGGYTFGKLSDGCEEIQALVRSAPSNVCFPGLVPHDKMNEFYNLADVMFLPSYDELFPMTILEAMNCRVPILLRDLLLYEGILTGYYQKGHSNGELMAQLQRLKKDPQWYETAAAMSWKGHEFYCRAHVAQLWRSFYAQVAEDTAPFPARPAQGSSRSQAVKGAAYGKQN